MDKKKQIVVYVLIGLFGLSFMNPVFAAVKKKKKPVVKTVKQQVQIPSKQEIAAPVETVKPEPSFFGEIGWGGGGLMAGVGYGNNVTDKIRYSGRIGYGIGNGYNVIALDVAQFAYNMGTYFLAIGAGYTMYSSQVQDVPGVFGTITNKNLFGLEMVMGRRFGEITGRLGYNTALGIRLSAGYGF